MLKITSILEYVKSEINSGTGRITILDDEHIIDNKTGVEFHLYDDSFKLTHGDKVVAKSNHFNKEEQDIIWGIKQMITDPQKAAERKRAYPEMVAHMRTNLSNLYERPEPIADDFPVSEPNAEEYTG